MRCMRALLSTLLICLLTFNCCLPAGACSFYTTVYFTYSTHPDIPMAPYARGRLGVVLKTYARSYLVVAWRYFQNQPLTDAEQRAALKMWNDRMGFASSSCEDASQDWLKARATVTGLPKTAQINIERPVVAGSYNTYCNCMPDSFRQASATLKERVTKYGAASNDVKEWVKAQDQVFANCGYGWGDKPVPPPAIPATLPASADKLAQADRAYQIAAAHFYVKDFDTAHKEFLAIAADSTSPWQAVSRYLAARALVRKGMLSKEEGFDAGPLEQAATELSAMLKDPSMQKLQDDITSLLRYCQVRVDPGAVVTALSADVRKQITESDLNEYTRTLDVLTGNSDTGGLTGDYNAQPATLKADEMTDWIVTVQSTGPESAAHAFSEWKSKKSLPWLVAAIGKVDAKSSAADAAEVVAAATALDAKSPGYFTAQYYLVDLETSKRDTESARKRLNVLLDTPQPELPPSSRNLFRSQRMQIARNLNEFMRDAFPKPVCLCGSGFVDEVPEDVEKLEASGKYPDIGPHIPLDTEKVIDGQFPLSVWLQAAQSPYTVAPIKKHFLWSGLTRAILLKNDVAAKKFAELVKPLDAKNAVILGSYMAETDPKTREFIGALILLRNNRSVPQISYGDYDEGELWWWGDQPGKLPEDQSYTDLNRPKPVAGFLTPEEVSRAAAEVKALNAVPTAPNYLSNIAIAWAKSHPADPRVPEALHLAVRCTHYGQTTDATSKLSKEAFQILHTRFKGNTWTKQTPYFY